MASGLVLVGRVGGAFGVRGEVRIAAFTEDPLALARYRALRREDGSPALTIATARVAKGGIIARCPEIVDKEAADALRGLSLYVPREALPEPEEDEFYLADLVGLAVETPEGAALGRVKAVHDFGAGDILEIEPADRRASFYLAFTREAVPTVDIPGRRLVAVLPTEVEGGTPEPL